MKKLYPILAGIIIMITYLVAFPNLLRAIEYDTLFLWTKEFAFDKLNHPQGITNWLAAYLQQFYYIPAGGALILGTLAAWTGVLLATLIARMGSKHFWAAVALPVLLATSCNGYPGELIQSVCFWSFFMLYTLTPHLRIPYTAFLLLIGYALFPWPRLIVWFMIAAIWELAVRHSRKASLIPLTGLLVSCFTPTLWSSFIAFIPFGQRYGDYEAYFFTFAYYLLPIGIVYVLRFAIITWKMTIINFVLSLIIIGWGCYTTLSNQDNIRTEKIRTLAFLADEAKWDEIKMQIDYSEGTQPILLRYALLAESQLGTLPEHLFMYPVQSTKDFLFTHDTQKYGLNFNRQFYASLGIYDEAFHQAFEYGTKCVDGHSLGSLRQMTTYALATGDTAVAKKYMYLMSRTTLHGTWLKEQEERLRTLRTQGTEPVVLRSQIFIGAMPFLSEMARIFEEDNSNKRVLDYILCGLLMERDLDKLELFLKASQAYVHEPLPKSYAEAIAMLATHDSTFKTMYNYPPTLDQAFSAFMQRLQNQSALPSTGSTSDYWYYFFIAPRPTNDRPSDGEEMSSTQFS